MNDTPTPETLLIHKVCNWLREESALQSDASPVPCRMCDLVVSCGPYGNGVLACVLRAQELIAIVRGES